MENLIKDLERMVDTVAYLERKTTIIIDSLREINEFMERSNEHFKFIYEAIS